MIDDEAKTALVPYRQPAIAPVKPGAMSVKQRFYVPRSKTHYYTRLALTALVAGALAVPSGGIVAAAFVVYALVQRRKVTSLAQQVDDAARRLASGDVEGPARELDALAFQATSWPGLHSVLVFNRAIAFLRSGDIATAVMLLDHENVATWLASPRLRLGGHVAATRATCEALRDDAATAQIWLEKARASVDAARKGVLVFPEVVIALRTGRYDQAAAIVETRWSEAEEVTGASGMRALRVLGAYARSRSVAPASDADVEATLAAARPFRPGELDYLAVAWPDLADFMMARGFMAPRLV